MERYKIILILILISLNMVSVVYSQNDSTLTIRTKPGFSIDYIAGFKNVYPYYAEIIDIKKLSFITDSTVKVSAEDSYEEINIDYINEISFQSGLRDSPYIRARQHRCCECLARDCSAGFNEELISRLGQTGGPAGRRSRPHSPRWETGGVFLSSALPKLAPKLAGFFFTQL